MKWIRAILKRLRGHGAEIEQLIIVVQHLTMRTILDMTTLQDKIDKLTSDVSALTTAEQSAVALITGLSQQLKDAIAAAQNAGATPEQLAALDALDASLTGSTADLAAAVTANTAPAAS